MPLFDLEDPQTGDIITVEHPQEPTQEEALLTFSNSAAPTPEAVSTTPVSQEQQSVEDFIKSQQAGPLSKLATSGAGLLDALIAQPVMAATRLPGDIIQGFQTPNPNVPVPVLGGQLNNAQTLAESGARVAFDLGNAINKAGSGMVREFSQNPLETSLKALMGSSPLGQLYNLRSRTPDQREINNFLADQVAAKQVEAVKSQPLLPEVLGKADLEGAQDISSAAALIPAVGPTLRGAKTLGNVAKSKIGSAIETVNTRGIFKQPLTAATTEALGITPIEGSQNIIPVVKRSVLDANGGKIPTSVSGKELLDKAADFEINQYINGLKLSEQQGLRHSTQSLIQAMEQRILRDHPTYGPSQVEDVLNAVRKENQALFASDYISPVEGQKYAVQINRDLNKTNPNRVPKTDAQVNAETALSQELSRQGGEMYQASTGTYGTPNQNWGALKQARDGFFGELKSAQLSDAGKNPGGSTIPTSKAGIASNLLRRVGGRSLVPTRAENVSNSLTRTLNESQPSPPVDPIDPIQQQNIIRQYTPAQAPVALPAAVPVQAPLSLNDQLKALNVPENSYRSLPDSVKQQLIDSLNTAPIVSPATARRVGRINP